MGNILTSNVILRWLVWINDLVDCPTWSLKFNISGKAYFIILDPEGAMFEQEGGVESYALSLVRLVSKVNPWIVWMQGTDTNSVIM